MQKFMLGALAALMFAGSLSLAAHAQTGERISVVSPGGLGTETPNSAKNQNQHAKAGETLKTDGGGSAAKTTTAEPATTTTPAKPAEKPAGTAAKAADKAGCSTEGTTTTTAAPVEQPKPPSAAQILTQAYSNFKSNPSDSNRAAILSAFKAFILSPGIEKQPVGTLVKDTPVLRQLGVRVMDAGSGRVWAFVRNPDFHQAFVQWADAKPQITYVGRRKKIKKVTYVTTWRSQELVVPASVTLKAAHVIGGAEGTRSLVLVGDEQGSTLWLHQYKISENGWAEQSGQFATIPSFLTTNVCGRVRFRGSDLIFNIARAVSGSSEGVSGTVPEADSSTYKFWLRLTDSGYVLDAHLPDEEQFATVKTFLDNLGANRLDAAKAMLVDPRCVSIPKYVGVCGPSSNFKVIEMSSPANGAVRYRLITGLQDDLIFDIITAKNKPMIKAVFIAPPDGLLQDIASHLVPYDRVAVPKPQPTAHNSNGKGA